MLAACNNPWEGICAKVYMPNHINNADAVYQELRLPSRTQETDFTAQIGASMFRRSFSLPVSKRPFSHEILYADVLGWVAGWAEEIDSLTDCVQEKHGSCWS